MTRDEWLKAFAERLGVSPPSPETIETLLALAGTAAHGSERTAAPIACFMVGMSGVDPAIAATTAGQVENPVA